MHLPKPPENGTDFKPPPSGTFPAVCTRVLDLGTQQTNYQGQAKTQHKILITWELVSEDAIMEDGRPFIVSERYTWSMSEKATLRKLLESWRGKTFTDADFGEGGFDIKSILGVKCLISIVHKEKPDKKVYANVASVSKLPKGFIVGEPQNDLVYLALTDRFDPSVLSQLSETLQHTIKSSPEYNELIGRRAQQLNNEAPPADYDGRNTAGLDDEIPF